jgi:hypothetical protein
LNYFLAPLYSVGLFIPPRTDWSPARPWLWEWLDWWPLSKDWILFGDALWMRVWSSISRGDPWASWSFSFNADRSGKAPSVDAYLPPESKSIERETVSQVEW